MKYIVCVTNFHVLVARAVTRDWRPDEYCIVDLRRRGDIGSFWSWLRSRYFGIIALIKCFVDDSGHVFVSHPYNLWFSLFVATVDTVSLYDDGIAYYNNSRTPRGFTAGLYSLISRRLSPLLSLKNMGGSGYADILFSAKINRYYCLYPEIFQQQESSFLDKIEPVYLMDSSCELSKQKIAMSGVFVFLDSTPEVVAHYDSLAIYEYLKFRFSASNMKFYYKPHPSGPTLLSALFDKSPWVSNIDGSFEDFVAREDILGFYSFYSSAAMIVRVYSEKTNIYCFSNESAKVLFERLKPLMSAIGAEVVCV